MSLVKMSGWDLEHSWRRVSQRCPTRGSGRPSSPYHPSGEPVLQPPLLGFLFRRRTCRPSCYTVFHCFLAFPALLPALLVGLLLPRHQLLDQGHMRYEPTTTLPL